MDCRNMESRSEFVILVSKYQWLSIFPLQFIENTIGSNIKYAYLGDLLSPL